MSTYRKHEYTLFCLIITIAVLDRTYGSYINKLVHSSNAVAPISKQFVSYVYNRIRVEGKYRSVISLLSLYTTTNIIFLSNEDDGKYHPKEPKPIRRPDVYLLQHINHLHNELLFGAYPRRDVSEPTAEHLALFAYYLHVFFFFLLFSVCFQGLERSLPYRSGTAGGHGRGSLSAGRSPLYKGYHIVIYAVHGRGTLLLVPHLKTRANKH